MSNLVNFGGLVLDTEEFSSVDVRSAAFVTLLMKDGAGYGYDDDDPADGPISAALRAWAAGLGAQQGHAQQPPATSGLRDEAYTALYWLEHAIRKYMCVKAYETCEVCDALRKLDELRKRGAVPLPPEKEAARFGLREAARELASAIREWELTGWRWTAGRVNAARRADALRIADALDAVDALLAGADADAQVDEEKVALQAENERLLARNKHLSTEFGQQLARVAELEAEELTEEMVAAGYVAYMECHSGVPDGIRLAYKAMRAAREGVRDAST